MMPPDKPLALLACVGLLAACQPSGREEPSAPATSSAERAPLPVAETPLDRAALLTAIGRATSDFALGRDDTERQRPLDGRLFELRLRFGCDEGGDGTRRWTFDERRRVLRISVEPEIAAQTPIVAEQEFEGLEAVEGFWIRQPWVLEAACPPRQFEAEVAAASATAPSKTESETDGEEAAPPAPPVLRIGIAQFFTAQDSRLRRRDSRAYEATAQLADGEVPSSAGYDFVLAGRLSRLPNGKTISCIADGENAPPRCIVAAEFDRVSVVRPDGEIVADWSRG